MERIAAHGMSMPKLGLGTFRLKGADCVDDEDRAAIAALPKDRRFVDPGFAPAWDAVGPG